MALYNRLRFKILSGFMILIMMLAGAGIVSIYEFIKLSNSVDALIEDNYKTIAAAKRMIDALEREDSGILLALLGRGTESRNIILSADSSFNRAFNIASNNITEPGEDKLLRELAVSYESFKSGWMRTFTPLMVDDNMAWYFDTIHTRFLIARSKVDTLMSLNQVSMYGESSMLKEKSKRAIMPGIVAIISALLFAVLLNFFISKYFVSPLGRLTDALKHYEPGRKPFSAGVETGDEIQKLETSIRQLIDKLTATNKDKES